MFDQIFVSPQVKRIVIISNKHGIYKLPHELPNDLRLIPTAFSPLGGLGAHTRKKKKTYDLRKLGNIKKISKVHRIIAWCSDLLPKLKFCKY